MILEASIKFPALLQNLSYKVQISSNNAETKEQISREQVLQFTKVHLFLFQKTRICDFHLVNKQHNWEKKKKIVPKYVITRIPKLKVREIQELPTIRIY